MKFNKIAICGSHSCGKTTLLHSIRELTIFETYPVINEIAAKYPVKDRGKMETQFTIMQHQAIAEKTLIKNYGKFLSDRSVLDNIAYCNLVYNHIDNYKKPKPTSILKKCEILSTMHLHAFPPSYDLLIFVDEILPYKESPHRNFNEYKEQVFIYEYIKKSLPDLKIPTIYVSGTTTQRIDTILEYIKYNANEVVL